MLSKPMVCQLAMVKSHRTVKSCSFPFVACHSILQGERTGKWDRLGEGEGRKNHTQQKKFNVLCVYLHQYSTRTSSVPDKLGIAYIVHTCCGLRAPKLALLRLLFPNCVNTSLIQKGEDIQYHICK